MFNARSWCCKFVLVMEFLYLGWRTFCSVLLALRNPSHDMVGYDGWVIILSHLGCRTCTCLYECDTVFSNLLSLGLCNNLCTITAVYLRYPSPQRKAEKDFYWIFCLPNKTLYVVRSMDVLWKASLGTIKRYCQRHSFSINPECLLLDTGIMLMLLKYC